MKARRKSDSEIIEVREWRGASDVIYSSPDMNQFYQASDLDFNLDAGTVIQGWLVRDKDGTLNLFYGSDKPIKRGQDEYWSVVAGAVFEYLPREMFPDLTWNSDPEEVELIIKRKKNG